MTNSGLVTGRSSSGSIAPPSRGSPGGSGLDSSVLQKEQERLREASQRQNKELHQMIAQELTRMQRQAKAESEAEARRAVEERMRQQALKRRLELEQRRFQAAQLRKEREDALQREHAARAAEKHAREAVEAKIEQEKKEQRMREEVLRKKEQHERQIEFKRQVEERGRQEQVRAAERLLELDRRDAMRAVTLERTRERERSERIAQSKANRDKLRTALKQNEMHRTEKIAKLRQKMREHDMHIQEFKERELAAAEVRRRQREEIEARRKDAQEAASFLVRRKAMAIIEKTEKAERYKHEMEDQRRHQRVVSHELKRLKQQEKLEQVERNKRRERYERDRLLQKLEAEAERAAYIKAFKTSLVQQRKYNAVLAEKQKKEVVKVFEKLSKREALGSLSSISTDNSEDPLTMLRRAASRARARNSRRRDSSQKRRSMSYRAGSASGGSTMSRSKSLSSLGRMRAQY